MSGDSSTKSLANSSKKTLPESSAKPLAVRTMVSNAKFEVEKFDGTNNFGMWQCEVMDVLVQQKLDITCFGLSFGFSTIFGCIWRPLAHLEMVLDNLHFFFFFLVRL